PCCVEHCCMRMAEGMPRNASELQLLARWLQMSAQQVVPAEWAACPRSKHQAVCVHLILAEPLEQGHGFCPQGDETGKEVQSGRMYPQSSAGAKVRPNTLRMCFTVFHASPEFSLAARNDWTHSRLMSVRRMLPKVGSKWISRM